MTKLDVRSGESGSALALAAAQLEQSTNAEQAFEQVYRIFDICGLGHGCLHALSEDYSPTQALWRVTPDDVTSACSNLVTLGKHPAVRIGKSRHFPFDMFEFREQLNSDPDVEALYTAFEANGVQHAYGLPIQSAGRGAFIFVVARVGEAIDTLELLTLQAICSNAVNGVHQFVRRPCDEKRKSRFTAGQHQLLIALAKGASFTDLSHELQVSELTVKAQMDHIVEIMGARNASHAIILALIEGEIGLEEVTASG